MNKKQFTTYILMLFTWQALLAQDIINHQFLLIGKVVKQDSLTAVPFAFVANSHSGLGKETDDNGLFKLNTSVSDTLFFRCMGYEDTMIVVTESMLSDTLLFCVQEKSYQLASVDVLMFKSYASFRHMVANMDMIPDDRFVMPIKIDIREVRKAKKEQEKTFGNGLAFGSGGMTRKEKKYVTFARNEERYARFRRMTSRANMKHLTKLEGTQLDSFMVFLRTKHNINPDLSDYKMMEAINLLFHEFLALRSDTLKNAN